MVSWIEAFAFAAALSTAACSRPSPAPFTREETERALIPARDLWQRCYVGSPFERAGTVAIVEYRLNVDVRGNVRSVPTLIHPEDPTLVECVRHRLDQLRFPARGKDHIDVHFELGPKGPATLTQPRGARLGTCDPPCEDGFSCHYEVGASRGGVCRVATGRCRFERDCAPSQACQRLSEPLGVCVERSP
ncbi:MAG TPA: hypothetical protein VG937_08655 [Polyangiaceae bacterium]|jgi:hypothetical protein|nr:hypothetical protein [Polyangiaceae bacterium]